MDLKRIDLLLKYILAAAGHGDPGHHEVGPIHLIKYVYLADLAFAEKHGGGTFTGAPWRFHHFGPWAPEVYSRIEPELPFILAVALKGLVHKFGDDTTSLLHHVYRTPPMLGAAPGEPLSFRQGLPVMMKSFLKG